MKPLFVALFSLFFLFELYGQTNANQTIEYSGLISEYQRLSDNYDKCDFLEFGLSDFGQPIHLFVINNSRYFFKESFQGKTVILIQNGIHPGEPCGVDASLQWVTKMLEADSIPENLVIGIIPIYNIGGMHNRSCCSRANQNGPEEYGFRGNARNLDLNRDYIKCDSKNTVAFRRIFHWLKPDYFIDTHTSNGADYQYDMTLLTSRSEKYSPEIRKFYEEEFVPDLFKNVDAPPYVNTVKTTPNSGIVGFNDIPRFSTGFVGLYDCMGLVTEAHMWKPFSNRVKATENVLHVVTSFANTTHRQFQEVKMQRNQSESRLFYSLNLKLDKSKSVDFQFKGFEYEYYQSSITNDSIIRYKRDQPNQFMTKWYNSYSVKDSIRVPKYYVIKSSWMEVISNLQSNQINTINIENDTLIEGEVQIIRNFETVKAPYEGHYLHRNIEVENQITQMKFTKGDVIIPVNQEGRNFLLTVFEAISWDSYFAWNFYDEILQQKEWFSSYIFEPYAKELLETNDEIRKEYELLLETDSNFAANGRNRLYWLYKQTEMYEKEHNLLPVLKVY